MKNVLKTSKTALTLLLIAGFSLTLFGCGKKQVSYSDGTYSGKSSVFQNDDGTEDGNGYGEVSLTIEKGKITDCTFLTYEEDGTLKDQDYGKKGGQIANRDFYNKAQKAVASCSEYANQLVSNGQLEGIDAISGATINYNAFVQAVEDALNQASQASGS